jgi:hypothetical protein
LVGLVAGALVCFFEFEGPRRVAVERFVAARFEDWVVETETDESPSDTSSAAPKHSAAMPTIDCLLKVAVSWPFAALGCKSVVCVA